MDLAVNMITLLGQLLVVAKFVEKLGVGAALALLPALGLAGFVAIGVAPVLAVLIAFQILRRAADYAIARPAREMLFTVLTREAKYKSKNFIDTVVFRSGDAASGWVYAALKSLGLGLAGLFKRLGLCRAEKPGARPCRARRRGGPRRGAVVCGRGGG